MEKVGNEEEKRNNNIGKNQANLLTNAKEDKLPLCIIIGIPVIRSAVFLGFLDCPNISREIFRIYKNRKKRYNNKEGCMGRECTDAVIAYLFCECPDKAEDWLKHNGSFAAMHEKISYNISLSESMPDCYLFSCID